MFDPTKEEEHNFIKLFEDFLYKDFRFFTTITFYPVGSIPLSEKQENGTYKRDCGESDPDCKITKHMICGNYKGEYSNIIGYWSYLQCMVRHGEYMFRNVDYCASSGHIDSKSVHECIEGEVGDQLLDEFIRVRNEDFKEVEPKDLPTVYLNKDKCTNNCGDMYPRLCNKIPGKLPTYCGGDQRLKFVPPPCKECRREEVMRPPGEVGSIPVEIFTDASCKWGNKFLMGPMTWLVNHKRYVLIVDLIEIDLWTLWIFISTTVWAAMSTRWVLLSVLLALIKRHRTSFWPVLVTYGQTIRFIILWFFVLPSIWLDCESSCVH